MISLVMLSGQRQSGGLPIRSFGHRVPRAAHQSSSGSTAIRERSVILCGQHFRKPAIDDFRITVVSAAPDQDRETGCQETTHNVGVGVVHPRGHRRLVGDRGQPKNHCETSLWASISPASACRFQCSAFHFAKYDLSTVKCTSRLPDRVESLR